MLSICDSLMDWAWCITCQLRKSVKVVNPSPRESLEDLVLLASCHLLVNSTQSRAWYAIAPALGRPVIDVLSGGLGEPEPSLAGRAAEPYRGPCRLPTWAAATGARASGALEL